MLLRCVVDRTIAAAIPANRGIHADLAIRFDDWQWHQGVALYGIVRAAECLEEPAYLSFAADWVDRQLAKGSPGKSINTTAPLLAIARLYEISGNPRYHTLCREFADWCLNDAPRLPDGTFEHSCTENRYPQQVWADTLFMGCLFIAKWGRIANDRRCLAEAAVQFVRHYHYLQDIDTGLIVHGYDGVVQAQKGVVWGRGNGWFAAASAEIASLLDEEQPERAAILENLRRHLAGVVRTQHPSGAWHTVMNRPDTYLEMSATAAFVYALRRSAPLGLAEVAGRNAYSDALDALTAKINARGELTEASGGTAIMTTAEDYGRVPCAPTCFAQGLAMLALCQPGDTEWNVNGR